MTEICITRHDRPSSVTTRISNPLSTEETLVVFEALMHEHGYRVEILPSGFVGEETYQIIDRYGRHTNINWSSIYHITNIEEVIDLVVTLNSKFEIEFRKEVK